MNTQIQLANFSFLCLLGSLIFYWVGLSKPEVLKNSFSTEIDEKNSIKVSSKVFEPLKRKDNTFTFLDFNDNIERTLGRYGIILANISLFILLGLRWKESGHFPLSNLYESLMFLSWSFTTLHLFLENSNLTPNKIIKDNFILIGAITTPSALFTNAFATFTLPKEMQEAAPLVPALQSNWLMMHVTVMIISYAALILGSLLSVAYLIITSLPSFTLSFQAALKPSMENSLSSLTGKNLSKDNVFILKPKFDLYSLSKTLDNLSYRILGIGFPFLTIGILSGAVWANEAWGSYWSWDPKETWALLTWLIFAIYLHARLNKSEDTNLLRFKNSEKTSTSIDLVLNKSEIESVINEDKKPAIIASFGFVVVWICYLGVNLIGEGLHSYGWFN